MRRLIPAHAGKTLSRESLSSGTKAHPRSRGENAGDRPSTARPRGSSPLTRGKRYRNRSPGKIPRLIPAHAGKTSTSDAMVPTTPAHPRSHGENGVRIAPKPDHTGSSPLTRGKLTRSPRRTKPGGLIPAHAGKTAGVNTRHWYSAAHPRSRGENHRLAAGIEDAGGSSPLTRGKHIDVERLDKRERLIPAHAGKTVPDRLCN